MYNRYLRNDQGVYTRLPSEEPRGAPPPPPPQSVPPPPSPEEGTPDGSAPREGFALLGRILDKLHLQDLDGADLLLLALLFLLFEEKADDELLIALGLLLIL